MPETMTIPLPVPDDRPADALEVRMQVGDLPVTVIGWIDDSAALPGLLRSVADETERIMRDRPEATGGGETEA
jgi:hypothetical protein